MKHEVADKPWWTSKTLIVNAVALLASLAAAQGFDIDANVQAELVAGILAGVNIVLRLVTDQPLTKRKEPAEMPVKTQPRRKPAKARTAMDEKEAPMYGYHKVEK